MIIDQEILECLLELLIGFYRLDIHPDLGPPMNWYQTQIL